MTKKPQINKSLIFIKSTVIAMGIVFLVLIILLAFAAIRKNKGSIKDQCNNEIIMIGNSIQKFDIKGNNILILTKPYSLDYNSTTQQEIIKLDLSCQRVISRTKFLITK